LGTVPAHAYLAVISQRQGHRMNVKNILRIGLLLIVAWFVLKIVFNLVGFVFHLLLIAGIIFVIYYVATNVLGKGRPRG
jgi:ABC-type iron transport system FetAB permease component